MDLTVWLGASIQRIDDGQDIDRHIALPEESLPARKALVPFMHGPRATDGWEIACHMHEIDLLDANLLDTHASNNPTPLLFVCMRPLQV